jgi:branched-chain amino acid transport system permease protein
VSAPAFSVVRTTASSRAGTYGGGVALVVLALVPFWASAGALHNLIEALTLLALAQMWNLLAGYAGLVSIGQQAFVGLGAYGLFIFGDKAGLHPFVAVVLAGLAAALIAIPTAALAFRLRGGYFAIGTWVIAEVYLLVIKNIPELGAGNGVTVSSAAQLGREARDRGAYWFALAVGAGAILAVYFILRSRLGLALTAIRDNEPAAQSLGVDVLGAKVVVYLVAALGCGLAGAVIYLNLLGVYPESVFSINWTVYMLFIVVIGGIGTIEGPILGTAVFFLLRELLADYGVWYLITLGAVAVIIMLWAPGGLWNLVLRRFDLRFFPVQRRLRIAGAPALAVAADAGGGPASSPGPSPRPPSGSSEGPAP